MLLCFRIRVNQARVYMYIPNCRGFMYWAAYIAKADTAISHDSALDVMKLGHDRNYIPVNPSQAQMQHTRVGLAEVIGSHCQKQYNLEKKFPSTHACRHNNY